MFPVLRLALKLKTKCHLDQANLKHASSSLSLGVQKRARNTANHQRHPSLSSCLYPSLRLVLSAIPHPPPGFPQRHVAMRVTLHSGRNSQLRSPLGTAPHAPQPPNYLAWSPPKIPWPPGHHTTQNNRTHQHFHLHPRASSDTAAAAVRPLTGTDRVLKSTKAL